MKCSYCDNEAVCVGRYESTTTFEPACDTCCGHGCEDGVCYPIDSNEARGALASQPATSEREEDDSKPNKPRKRSRKEEFERCHAMAVMIGAHEIVRMEPRAPLGIKVFWRMMADDAKRLFEKLGGTIGTETHPGPRIILTSCPSVRFYETDVEAMRKVVFDYDAAHGVARDDERTELRAKLVRAVEGFEKIAKLGRVCPEFDICAHDSCADSCSATLTALDVLRDLGRGEGKS